MKLIDSLQAKTEYEMYIYILFLPEEEQLFEFTQDFDSGLEIQIEEEFVIE